MARSITHGGVTTYRPSALSDLQVGNDVPVPSTTGYLGMVGEGSKGTPGVVETIDDPKRAKVLFGSGDLADGINLAFNASADDAIDGGASRVYAVQTNQSSKAHGQLNAPGTLLVDGKLTAGSDVLEATGPGFGALAEKVQIDTVADVAGSLDQTYFLLYDKDGSVAFWYDVDNSGSVAPAGATAADRAVKITTVTTGMTADQVAAVTATDIGADSQFGATVPAGNRFVVTDAVAGYRDNASAGDSGFTMAIIQQGVNGVVFTQSEVGAVVEITSISSSGGEDALGLFEISAVYDDAKHAVLEGLGAKISGLSPTPASGVKYRILHPQLDIDALKYGEDGNRIVVGFEDGNEEDSYAINFAQGAATEQSADLGYANVLTAQYVGNNSEVKLAEPTAEGVATDTSKAYVDLPAFEAGTLAGKYVLTDAAGSRNLRKLISHYEDTVTAPATPDVLVPSAAFTNDPKNAVLTIKEGVILAGTATGGSANTLLTDLLTDIAADDLINCTLVITAGTGAGQYRVISDNGAAALGAACTITVDEDWETNPSTDSEYEVRYTTDAHLSVYGEAGKATKLLAYARTNGSAEADVFSMTFQPTTTLQDIVDSMSSSGKYQVQIANGIPTSRLASEFDYGINSKNWGVDIRRSSMGLKMTAKSVVDWVGINSALVSASRSVMDAGESIVYDGLEVTPTVAAKATSVDVAAGWIQIGGRLQYYAGGTKGSLTREDSELYLVVDQTTAEVVLTLETNKDNPVQNINKTFLKLAQLGVEQVAVPTADIVVTMNPHLSTLTSFKPPVSSVGGYVPDALSTEIFLGSQVLHSEATADSGTTTTLVDSSANFSEDLTDRTIEFTSGPGAGNSRRIIASSGTSITFKPALSSAVTSSTKYQITNKAIRGISTNSDVQDALDELLKVRCEHVVGLFSEDTAGLGYGSTVTIDSFHAQAKDHVLTAEDGAKSERDFYLAYKGNKTQLIAQAAQLNHRNLTLCGGHIVTALDADGQLRTYPEWGFAVVIAGMRSGAEIALPLTNKLMNIQGLTQDSSWDPRDETDVNELLAGGVLIGEVRDGEYVVVRDITTHLSTENISFIQGSSNAAANLVVYENRTSMEKAFIGDKAIANPVGRVTRSVATVAGIKGFLDTRMDAYVRGNILAFYDPKTTKVTISGNVATISYKFEVVNGLEFMPLTEILNLPV